MLSHVDSNGAVYDLNILEEPDPIPVHKNRGVTMIKRQVRAGKLLISRRIAKLDVSSIMVAKLTQEEKLVLLQ